MYSQKSKILQNNQNYLLQFLKTILLFQEGLTFVFDYLKYNYLFFSPISE